MYNLFPRSGNGENFPREILHLGASDITKAMLHHDTDVGKKYDGQFANYKFALEMTNIGYWRF